MRKEVRGTMGSLALLTGLGLTAAAWHSHRFSRDALDRNPPVGRFVEIEGGHRLHYVEAGEGPPIVLIHGASNLLQDMTTSLMPVLARRHRVVAFDRPGHGHSTRRLYRAWDEAQARALHEGVRRLGLEKPVIVGHSIGGGIAMSYGMQFPDELTGVVFLGGLAFAEVPSGLLKFAGPATPLLGSLLSHTIYPLLQPRLLASMHQKFFHPQTMPEHLRQALPIELLHRPEAIKMNAEDQVMVVPSLVDLQLHYADYPLPVVVMAGEEDQTTDPKKHAIPLSEKLPSCSLRLFAGLGHMIHHFAQDAIAEAVEGLFNGTPARPAATRAPETAAPEAPLSVATGG
jgi:pimeloyl-ACP methyl ester carboxylesterase